MNYTFRPLGPWLEGNTRDRRSRSTFKATWTSTLRLMENELLHLDAKLVVIQADFTENDIRNDGLPKANARQPAHPGVRIAFESRHGPLTYATDSCDFWQHNVRSIAVGLEALRAVDRYGVTKRGEQYTGWKQLPSANSAGPTLSQMDAAAIIRPHGTFKAARFATHPDRNGGDATAFMRVEEAGRVLGLSR